VIGGHGAKGGDGLLRVLKRFTTVALDQKHHQNHPSIIAYRPRHKIIALHDDSRFEW
jgi:hypothetical protein